MQTVNINSNITLRYIPMSKLKTTTIGIYIHRPLVKEEASMNALLPYVLKRGCKKCKNLEEISKYLENLYGASFGAAVSKCGDDQIIYFDAETISDKYTPENEPLLSGLLSLMLSVLFEPVTENGAFAADIMEQEKKNAADRIAALVNDKRSYAFLRCQEEMCKGEAFAISRLGTTEGINEITPQKLYDYYKSMITSSVIDIYICGEADVCETSEAISEFVKDLEFTKAEITGTSILKKSSGVNNITEEMNIVQGNLSIGFRTNTPANSEDYPALMVFNSVFGAGAHSKLFNNVREKLSLAYYASSQIERYKGLLVVNAGIEFENFQKAYDETIAQLEEIKKGNISELEFASSINSIVSALDSCVDDQRTLQSFYMREIIAGENGDLEELKAKIKAVTTSDITKTAQKLELDTVYFLKGKEDK